MTGSKYNTESNTSPQQGNKLTWRTSHRIHEWSALSEKAAAAGQHDGRATECSPLQSSVLFAKQRIWRLGWSLSEFLIGLLFSLMFSFTCTHISLGQTERSSEKISDQLPIFNLLHLLWNKSFESKLRICSHIYQTHCVCVCVCHVHPWAQRWCSWSSPRRWWWGRAGSGLEAARPCSGSSHGFWAAERCCSPPLAESASPCSASERAHTCNRTHTWHLLSNLMSWSHVIFLLSQTSEHYYFHWFCLIFVNINFVICNHLISDLIFVFIF